MKEGKSLLKGAALLTAAALVVKILSASYRVPFQNIVGDTGFYIYQQVYPFYGIAASLAVTGFPVVLSRMLAEETEEAVSSIVKSAFFVIGVVSALIFSGLFFASGWLAAAMGDLQLKPLIQLSSFCFLLIPYVTVRRGAFQGSGIMMPTAASQMGEQFVRVACILLLSFYAVSTGKTLYEAGMGAVAGSLIGIAASGLILWKFSFEQSLFSGMFQWGIAARILKSGTAVCLAALTLVLLQLADSFQIYNSLVASGWSDSAAKEEKGIYDRGQPLVQLGVVAAVSISLAVVPLVTAARKEGNEKLAFQYSQTALRISFVIGLAASAGLAAVIVPLNKMLFETSNGSSVLAVFGLSIFMYSLLAVMSAIFQGTGREWLPAAAALAAFGCKWAANALLVPIYGLHGASAATVFSLLIALLFLGYVLRREARQPFFNASFLIKTIFIAGLMAGVVYGFIEAVVSEETGRAACGAAAVFGALLGICVFFAFMLKWNVLRKSELLVLPFGEKLAVWSESWNKRT